MANSSDWNLFFLSPKDIHDLCVGFYACFFRVPCPLMTLQRSEKLSIEEARAVVQKTLDCQELDNWHDT